MGKETSVYEREEVSKASVATDSRIVHVGGRDFEWLKIGKL